MTRMLRLWVLLYALLSLDIVVADESPCSVHADGKYYDLSQVKSSKDYKFKSLGGREYLINVCRAVATETWAVDNPEQIGGFTRRDHGDFSIGTLNTTLSVMDGNPLIVMTGGSSCASGGDLRASTAIRFVCDTSVYGAGEPQLIAQFPPSDDSACNFFIEWRTHVACPTSKKSGWGFVSILALILGLVFMLYLTCGILYNAFVLELRGFDLIPRFSCFSFSDTVQYIRDCIDRVRIRSSDTLHFGNGGMRRSWGNSGGGYRGLAVSREEQTSTLGGPPGFLDESDDEETVHGHDDPECARPQGMDPNGVIRL